MNLKLNNRFVIYILTQTIVALLYYSGSISIFNSRTVALTSIDIYVKPHFLAIWFYLSFFLLLLLTVYLSDRKNMILFIKIVFCNSIISLFIFIIFPTYIVPADFSILQKNNPISFALLSFVINNDVRSNCFPSLHIANSLLASLFLMRLKNKLLTLISIVWFVLISWSVLSTGQHYFYDVLGGIILTIISYYITVYLSCMSLKTKN